MTQLEINLTKSVEENAAHYFEESKKAKKKLKGIQEIIIKTQKKLEQLQKKVSERQAEEEKKISEQKPARKAKWYEKFRWFYSSAGFLCIGGRDATTNEILIKKHAQKGDLVFHTDMAGSPFFIIKADEKEIDASTIQEVADATCSFSRAWSAGLSTTSVFCVNPDQVTKESRSGEYLSKGAFVIKGKTNYVQNRMNLAIGIYDDTIMSGPVEAIKKHCEKYVEIEQAREKTSSTAKAIKHFLEYDDLDGIIRALPAGGCKIKRKLGKNSLPSNLVIKRVD